MDLAKTVRIRNKAALSHIFAGVASNATSVVFLAKYTISVSISQ